MKEIVQTQFRQTIAVLVALALVLSVFGPAGTAAAQSVSVSNSAEQMTAAPGDTVTITTSISASNITGEGLQVSLPSGWQGEITDADGGAPKPEEGKANGLEVVWLSSGAYEVSYDVYVPEDASAGDYIVDAEGSGIDPETDDQLSDTAQTTITVEDPNQPPTADAGADQSVEEGDSVSLDASDSSDPDGDDLSYTWTQTAGPSVSLDDDTSATPSFTAPEVDTEQTVTLEVEVDDGNGGADTDTVNVDVQNVPEPDPANFEVSNLDAPDSAIQGDAIDVSADITNAGDEEGTQTVEFRLDLDGDDTLEASEMLAEEDVTLAGSDSETVQFSDLDTSGLEAGDYTHGVVTDNDSATATITVEEPEPDPANFEVSDLEAPDSATQGDAIDVSANVTNDGGQQATQTVEFRLGSSDDGALESDDALTSQDVTLDAGETQTVTFSDLDTSGLEAGDYTHGVFTDNDSATATITLEEPEPDPANFEVSNLNAPDSATKGDAIDVSANVTNDGGQQATQTVEFRLDLNGNETLESDEALVSEDVTLDAGETQTVTFSDLDTSGLETGDFMHGVVTDDDSATATITIEKPAPDPANFEVSNLNAPDSATQGDAIDVSADITNAGDEEGTQTVDFRLDVDGDGTLQSDETLASEDVTLTAGENQTVTFSDLGTSGLEAGDYTHGVVTDNGSATATITIEEPDTIGPIGNFESPPADPDDEGLYEDVNGDGTFDVVDVQALFNNLDDDTVQEYSDAFDFNGDGSVDVVDVQKLFNEVN